MARRMGIHTMVQSRKAPRPTGPYAQGVRVEQPGCMLFVSGQIPLEVPTGQVFTGAIQRQAELALTHMKNVVLDAGFELDHVVRCTVYLVDLAHTEVVNAAYQKLFVGHALPARVMVQVAGLPQGVGIEVDAIAVQAAPGARPGGAAPGSAPAA